MTQSGLDLIGTHIGGYRIARRLGAGAMGTVYLAEHAELQQRIAVKVLVPAFARHPEVVRRFLQEAKSVSEIHHPNIIEVRDFNQMDDGTFYMAMEFVEGQSLQQLLEATPRLSLARAISILAPVADALDAAHQKQIVHRDVKPDNIMVRLRAGAPDDEVELVKLLDFGIAKVLREPRPGSSQQLPRTVIGTVMGTPRYMSPEQSRGDVHLIGPTTDIYALGVILYECLAGRAPFVGTNPLDLALLHNQRAPPPLDELSSLGAKRREVEAVVLRCLAKRPDERWPSAGALSLELRRLLLPAAPQLDPAALTLRSSSALPRADLMTVRGLTPATIRARLSPALRRARGGSLMDQPPTRWQKLTRRQRAAALLSFTVAAMVLVVLGLLAALGR